jgi:hypothetical protein
MEAEIINGPDGDIVVRPDLDPADTGNHGPGLRRQYGAGGPRRQPWNSLSRSRDGSNGASIATGLWSL